MKNMKKRLVALLCAVVIVATSVAATVAYLTDSETVVNTFSVGQVHMTMDETDVKPDGTKDTDTRVKENTYHLLPGRKYIKDPVIHIDADSEDCYVFVKVDNQIADYESKDADYESIAKQIENNGWATLDGVEKVFYKVYTKGQADKDLEVFEEFKIDTMANDVGGWDDIDPQTTKVNVTGYAVQKAGFGTAKAAWDATFAQETEEDDVTVVTTEEEFEAAWNAGGKVKLGTDVKFEHTTNPYVPLPDIILDLNGKKLIMTDSYGGTYGDLISRRNLTIMDSQGGGTLYARVINASYNSEVKITSGTYNCDLTGSTGTYTITGGTFYGELAVASNFNITGGTFFFQGYTEGSPETSINKLKDSVPPTHPTHQVIDNLDGSFTVTAK